MTAPADDISRPADDGRKLNLPARGERLEAIDILRGIIMVLMALDHVRDYFTVYRFDPLDLSRTFPALFLTRWITHFCAPLFVFLAGTSAFLSGSRGKSRGELSRFLAVRGIWLVILELTVVRFGWFFNFDLSVGGAGVIWAIGWSMIFLSLLVFLPLRWIGVFGLGMMAIHNAFDPVTPEQLGPAAPLWTTLHEGGRLPFPRGLDFYIGYPLVPWIGVMAAGYAFGSIMRREAVERRRLVMRMGIAATAAFILLRATNFYGNPAPWIAQKNVLFSIFSFIDCWKYPPSLLYLLMTIGPGLVVLSLLDRAGVRGAGFWMTFGRVPLFYYLIHLPLIHGAAVALAALRGQPTAWLFANPPAGSFWSPPEGYGYGLPGVYLVWIAVVLTLYPACRWFAGVKARSRSRWLSYL